MSLGPDSQERLEGSRLAGVTFPEPSWNWADDSGSRTDAIRAAATVLDRNCGATEFHAFQAADPNAATRLREGVESAFRNAGWQFAAPAVDEDGQAILLAEKGDAEVVVEWLRLDDQQALALFLCEARAADAPPFVAPAPAAQGGTAAGPAEPAPAARDEDEIDPLAFVLGIGLVFGLAGAGFIWNTVRHRRFATAAQT